MLVPVVLYICTRLYWYAYLSTVTAAVHWYTVHVLWFTMYEFVREMTVNLSGEFSKDLVQKQDGRFPAGECAL